MAYQRDRDITREIPGYRRMLAFITPDRDAASVTFTQTVDLTRTLPWIQARSEEWGTRVSLLAVYLAAAGRLLNERPGLNRYVTGTRFYQRDGVTITISAKKKLAHGAKIVMLKLPIGPEDGVREVVETLEGQVRQGRGDEDLRVEKEVDLFLRLPGFLLRWALKLVALFDRLHWLPGFFVDPDPMFTSMAVANLGSVGLDAAHHHLYEYGNCPFFVVIGRIQERAVPVGDRVEIREVADVKYTFDERIEDGLACAIALASLQELVEDPERFTDGRTPFGEGPPSRV